MAYDLLIKNGRIIDGSGRPAFHGDVGVMRGKIAELGRLDGPAKRTIEADGRLVALGLSITRNMNHFELVGKRIPAACAPESELFALADVLREVGTGVIQCGGGTNPELKDKLLSRIAQACGRPIMYNTLLEQARQPGRWRTHLQHVEETARQGIRAIPLCNPGSIVNRFTMKNCQVFRSMPTWLPILQGSDSEKLSAYRDPEIRAKLRAEVDAPLDPGSTFSQRWDLMLVEEPKLPKNRGLAGKHIAEIAKAQGKHPVDAFLDLAVDEELDTVFSLGEINMDTEAVAQILGSPYAVVGLSDGGAHVQFHSNVSNPTRLLGYWVREKKIMSLERAVQRLTFDSASAFGIYDRGLLQPGMVADLVVFDPDTVAPRKEDVVHDFPANGWRMRELADGIHYTVVNGEVLLEKGEHTGAHPGRVLRNARYHASPSGGA